MTLNHTGTVLKGVGGLYTIRLDNGTMESCRARGLFRHQKSTVLPGDRVDIQIDDTNREAGLVISNIYKRRNQFVRPAVANLDYLFLTFATTSPDPDLLTVDKLLSIAVVSGIQPIICITKADLNAEAAQQYAQIYQKSGFPVFVTSSLDVTGVDAIRTFIRDNGQEKLFAFAGASGVGKSSFLNVLFPTLDLTTGTVSEKTERGRHTTRAVQIFEQAIGDTHFFIADTPGFTMVDFVSYLSISKEDLAETFPEFRLLLGNCRWHDCTHTSEDHCAIQTALQNGTVSQSRYDNYCQLFKELQAIPEWKRVKK